MKNRRIDPVTLELIRCRLEAGAQQMGVSLWKSSFSTVIREVLDYSTAIFDIHGNIVAQSAQLPFQMMTMSAPLHHLCETSYPWAEGDVILLNDPYQCAGQHLPDFMTFRPVFHGGQRIGFAGAIAHMIDVGGGAPGSYLATATEIYQEGLRLPPLKVCRSGRENKEILDIIRLNVREPEKLIGDLTAMIACTTLGETILHDLIDRYQPDTVSRAVEEILDGSERQFRLRLEEIPDGVYKGVDYVDDDGISEDPVRIQLTLTVKGAEVMADFSGSSPQARGPLNATFPMIEATVNYTFMAAIGEGIPKNDGCRRTIEIIAPEGTVVNARSPAPVASRVTTCHRVVDVTLQALGQAIPDKVMAGYYGVSSICNLGGYDEITGKPWVHFEIEVGGWGARPTSDGLDAFSAHIHNLANTPIEVIESSLPIRVERYELVPGSGGKGKFRGGLGLRRDIRVLTDQVSLNLLSDRCKFPPRGMLGGGNGRPGVYLLNPGTEEQRIMPNKLSNHILSKGDVISMQTAGGGGFGDPSLRETVHILRDREEGKIKEDSNPKPKCFRNQKVL